MIKYLLLLLLLSSCNFFKTVTGADQEIDNGFVSGKNTSTEETNKTTTLYNDLFAFWRFDENSGVDKLDLLGNITLIDNANSGAIPVVGSPRGSGLNFSGQTSGSGLLSTPTTFYKSATDDWAISLWVYLAANVTGGCSAYNTLFNFSGSSGMYIMFENVSCSGGLTDIQIFYSDTTYTLDILNIIDFAGGAWHHVVLNFISGGSFIDLFIDGELISTHSTGSGRIIDASIINVGSDSAGNQKHIGRIDSIGIWNRVLTTEEVSELYAPNLLDP